MYSDDFIKFFFYNFLQYFYAKLTILKFSIRFIFRADVLIFCPLIVQLYLTSYNIPSKFSKEAQLKYQDK